MPSRVGQDLPGQKSPSPSPDPGELRPSGEPRSGKCRSRLRRPFLRTGTGIEKFPKASPWCDPPHPHPSARTFLYPVASPPPPPRKGPCQWRCSFEVRIVPPQSYLSLNYTYYFRSLLVKKVKLIYILLIIWCLNDVFLSLRFGKESLSSDPTAFRRRQCSYICSGF